MYKGFGVSTFSSSLATVWLFDYGNFSGYVVISHCVLICISLMNSDAEYIFMS